jgi:hypothetical protein
MGRVHAGSVLRAHIAHATRSRNAWALGPRPFVIYYSSGRVPQPGIVILGKVTGDISIFDRPGSIAIRVQLENQ